MPETSRTLARGPLALGAFAVALLGLSAYLGLSWAPSDRDMGEVQRIMYAHVPAVWIALLAMTLNFGASIAYLIKPSARSDALGEASAEVGLLFGAVGVMLGAIWGKPTWGVWWTWDPRLTAAAIMVVTYMGLVAMRHFVEDPERRAVWASVGGIIAFANLPIVWFSVRWWRGLHQIQSTPKTVHPDMALALRVSAFAALAFMIFFLWSRYRLAMRARQSETALPEAAAPTPLIPLSNTRSFR